MTTETEQHAPTITLSSARNNATIIVLAIATVLTGIFSIFVVPMLPAIGSTLHQQPNAVNWLLTAALLSGAATMPLFARLGDVYGHRRLIVAALVIAIVGSLLCAVSTSLTLLIVGRALQGVGAVATSLGIGIVRRMDASVHHRGIGMVSAGSGLGIGIGFLMGGLFHSWRMVFWVGFVFAIVVLFAVLAIVPNDRKSMSTGEAHQGIDWLGAVLLAMSLVAALLVLSEGQAWGWKSGRIVGLVVAFLVLFIGFWMAESRVKTPLVQVKVLHSLPISLANITAITAGICMGAGFLLWVGYASTPPALGYGFGASELMAGSFLLPNAIMVMVTAPIAGMLCSKVGAKPVLMSGMTLGIISFIILSVDHSNKLSMYILSGVWGIAAATALVSLYVLVTEAASPEYVGVTASLVGLTMSVGSSSGSAIFSAVLTSKLIPHTPVPAASGYTHSFIGAAIFAAVGLVAAIGSSVTTKSAR